VQTCEPSALPQQISVEAQSALLLQVFAGGAPQSPGQVVLVSFGAEQTPSPQTGPGVAEHSLAQSPQQLPKVLHSALHWQAAPGTNWPHLPSQDAAEPPPLKHFCWVPHWTTAAKVWTVAGSLTQFISDPPEMTQLSDAKQAEDFAQLL
jgi:hypothetical protein